MTKRLSVCAEADQLTTGDRRSAYGHPFDNFSRVAGMLNCLFAEKMKPDRAFEAEDIGLIMIVLKLSRCANQMKRDNVVDIAGYANTLGMIMDRKEGVL